MTARLRPRSWDRAPRAVVIGAGIGGLSAAAVLACSGLDVTVLEAHVYPGGCAGTFYHQGYRFDAGATLAAGFYPNGPMALLAEAAGVSEWPARAADPAMVVHLPDGVVVPRSGGPERWDVYRTALGAAAEPFFRWQEATADALWNLALRGLPWPPRTADDVAELMAGLMAWARSVRRLRPWAALALDAFRPVAVHLRGASDRLRLFVDAQLLISAQAVSHEANALYGAAALDLPRRGVVHPVGGMGSLAEALAQAVRAHGSRILYRQAASRIHITDGAPVAVETARGDRFPADLVVANLTPWDLARLLGEAWPRGVRRTRRPPRRWGAFVVYMGIDAAVVPAGYPLHHQVVVDMPLGEGRSIFLSLSPAWDATRAPVGHRAATISMHTALDPWWELYERDRPAYEARRAEYTDRLIAAAERALPRLREATSLILPGTPVTFARFTRRAYGWVGGFPQVSLWESWEPRVLPGIWMVGDSIFPGQSVPAAALGGLRVARQILRACGMALPSSVEAALQAGWNAGGAGS